MSEKAQTVHKPVLLHEVLELLDPKEGDVVLDGTLGGGGHAKAIAERIGESGVYIGLDQDVDAIDRTRATLAGASPELHTVLENFRNMDAVLEGLGREQVDIVFLDLGLSSDQLEQSGRGFTFQGDEPLLMTMKKDSQEGLTAKEIVNSFDAETIEVILKNYGEERFARKIAGAVVKAREAKEIATTGELKEIIEKAVPKRFHGKIHPATKTFQALRIATNDEFRALEVGLQKAWEAIGEGGRIGVISFHSLEDRAVKNFFRDKRKAGLAEVLTKKPVGATDEEKKVNPRSRSAKLRVLEKRIQDKF